MLSALPEFLKYLNNCQPVAKSAPFLRPTAAMDHNVPPKCQKQSTKATHDRGLRVKINGPHRTSAASSAEGHSYYNDC